MDSRIKTMVVMAFISFMLLSAWILIKDTGNKRITAKKYTPEFKEKEIKPEPLSFTIQKTIQSVEKKKKPASFHKDKINAKNVSNAKTQTGKSIDLHNEIKKNDLIDEIESQDYIDAEEDSTQDLWASNQYEPTSSGIYGYTDYPSLTDNQDQATQTSTSITDEVETEVEVEVETELEENREDNGEETDIEIAGIWDIYTESSGEVYEILDPENDSNYVIQLEGNEEDTGYRNTFEKPIIDKSSIEWKMKYAEEFTVYVSIDTELGHRFLYYTSDDFSDLEENFDYSGIDFNDYIENEYIHHGLGTEIQDGQWRTITRNLVDDLQEAQPDNEIISINALMIRGSGLIDDLKALQD